MHTGRLEPDALHGSARRVLQPLVQVIDTLDSTNTHLLDRAAELPDGTVLFAESQTAGRGRFQRKWEAPRGASILVSILLYEPHTSPLIELATLFAAAAVCEAVEQSTSPRPAIRWPNDVLIDGRKVCGVLAETATLPSPPEHPRRALVIGIGINVLQQPGHFPPELLSRATSLEIESTTPVDRQSVAKSLLASCDRWIHALRTDSSAPSRLLDGWRRRLVDLGTSITVDHDGRRFTGAVENVTDSGDLIVRLSTGELRTFDAATTTRHFDI
jgi:BirA family biotin operon repressor/biotin-[acetyl-CoA-carboxylase] ligase